MITWRPSFVVCKLFTFQASSPKPLGRLEPNLAGMFLGWAHADRGSIITMLHFLTENGCNRSNSRQLSEILFFCEAKASKGKKNDILENQNIRINSRKTGIITFHQ
jgi:hypothetical protein